MTTGISKDSLLDTHDTARRKIREKLDWTKNKIYYKTTIINGGVAQSVRAQDS